VLALAALVYLGYGFAMTWGRNYDGDLEERAREYALFRIGVYPHYKIERAPAGFKAVGSVYPPYAYPQMALFFEPGGKLQARILIELLSLASLALMAWFAHHTLRPYGREIALVGAVAVVAIAGNGTALALGQFSIICVGLITVQWLAILGRRPIVAGIAWGMAMLKPQIALPFVLLFLAEGLQLGSVVGVALVALLSWMACLWTEVPVRTVIDFWRSGMSMRFAAEGYGLGPGAIARWLGADHRIVQVAMLGGMLVFAVPLVVFMRRHGRKAILPVAAACGVIGMFACYHRPYDHVMLFPTLLGVLVVAAGSRRAWPAVVAVAMVASLVIPARALKPIPRMTSVQAVVWATSAVLPLAAVALPRRRVAARAPQVPPR